MSFWKGLPVSVIVHAAAAGIVLASISPEERVEDIASAPVELVLEIESSPAIAQQPAIEEAEASTLPEAPVNTPAEKATEEPALAVAQPEPEPELEPKDIAAEAPAPQRDLPPPSVPTPDTLIRQASQSAELTAPAGVEALPAAPPAAEQPKPKRAGTKPAQKRSERAEKRQPAKTEERKKDRKESRSRKAERQTAVLAAGRGSDGRTRSTDGRALEQSYKSKVLARLRSVKRYPEAARRKGLEGTAVLSFTINARGQVTAARISGRSGHVAIDGAALAMARNAAPFPPFPPGIGRQQMSFRVPVQFKID